MNRRSAAKIIALVLALIAGTPALAGTMTLDSFVDQTTGTINLPASQLLVATVNTSGVQGGNDASDTTVTIGGTVVAADIADVCVDYGGTQVTCVTNPSSLTNLAITLAGNQKGGSPFDYRVTLNSSAAGKTFQFTVVSITNAILTDNIPLPQSTATRTISSSATAPNLDASTFSAVSASSATLGGNIVDTGGATITERGTVWGLATNPTGNGLAEGGTTTGSFSHSRTGLNTGALIYVRSYAVNSVGTGYGPNSQFYTEPANSPASVTIDTVGTTSFRLSWPVNPAGDGDGALIVVSTNSITAVPVDGTEHAFSSVYGSGADLGTSEFVVYRGAGTSVTVTGLSASTSYNVAAFYYAGAGTGTSGINYRQTVPATNSQTTQSLSAPTLDASTFSAISASSATLGGNIVDNGGDPITARGTVWNATGAPITENALAEGGTATGSFSHSRTGLNTGTLIYSRAYAVNGVGTGYGPDNQFYTEPASSPASVTIDTVTENSFRITWPANPAGDGDGALVVVSTNSITATPTDGTQHAFSSVYGAGADLGTSEFVVYRGVLTEVTVTGLSPSTSYNVAAFYYAGTGTGASGINYRQSAPATSSQTTNTALTVPTVTSPTRSAVTATTATLGANVTSDGGATITQRGTVWGLTPSPTTNATAVAGMTGVFSGPVTGLSSASQIFYRGYATNSQGTGYSADDSFYTEPTSQPASVTISGVTTSSMDLSWSGGTGTGSIVVVKEGSAVDSDPVDGTEHAASSVFGSGAQLGTGNYVVYRSTGAAVTVTGLSPSTTYYVAVYEYAGSGTGSTGINYLQSPPATSSATTPSGVSQASNVWIYNIGTTSMTVRWTEGAGDGSIVVMKEGAPVDSDPVDGTEHAADSVFGSGAQLGTGNFVVYRGNGELVNVSGLSQTLTYYVAVYTYTGAGVSIDYLQIAPATGNQTTADHTPHNVMVALGDPLFDCTSCHTAHGGSFLARGTDQETVCVTCHNPSGSASAKLNFALHTNAKSSPPESPGLVDCGSCHELHNPSGNNTVYSQNPETLSWGYNKHYFRTNVDKYVSTAVSGAVLHNDTSSDDWALEGGAGYKGACQSCHTITANYRNVPGGNDSHQGSGTANVNCRGCHTHDGAFAGAGGDCTACHNSAQDKDGPGGNPGRRIVVAEFSGGSIVSSHLPGTLDPADCEVCHDQSNHQQGQVTLFDQDGGASIQLGLYADPTTDPVEAAKLTTFCLSCHDSNGANGNTSPFTTAGTTVDVSTDWTSASHNTNGSLSCFGDGQFGCHGSGHGGQKLTLLAPSDVGPGTNNSDEREQFCFNCHDADGPSTFDISSLFNHATNYRVTSVTGALVNQRHDVLPADQSYSGGAVTCSDCHHPHKNTSSNKIKDPDTGANFVGNYAITNSYTDEGYNFTYYGSKNATDEQDPTNPAGATGGPYVVLDYVQFCLTCHDGVTPPGVTMSANVQNMADAWSSDQHGAGAGSTGSKIGKGGLKMPWTTQAEYDAGLDPAKVYAALNCNQCHGPHGWGNIFNLRDSITVAGTVMTVGTFGNGGDFDSGGAAGVFGNSTYTLPVDTTSGSQTDHRWGAWCSFCHKMDAHPTVYETTDCPSAHTHGSNNF